ncbi:MFS general substrate transporter [Fomitiporia mediterranea MF3/22]|uniref:MFS general substrate transporter n=1 Tax=Fomitiporia mediterranea (strain MF3/22) TaxID=694068 RepID=UPI0004408439|nr:MFS general substrate transporter [Fomitiporia mediterranea MF3/22]EJD00111.1 MFS general substrate transporter [Fomitiporia mediterranea MF3/22]
MSNVRRAILLAIFCLALFVDAFMTSAMIICLDSIGSDFNQSTSILSWVLTAYSLTFGSFLLLAGRISDIYHPKPVFIAGFYLIGFLGIGAGFVKNIIGLIIIRAIQGIGAAMTIPSATAMLTATYPAPKAQGIALTLFAAAGTLGLCLGFVLGGIIVQLASWHWVVWVVPMVTVPLSTISIFLIPGKRDRDGHKDKKMDIPGVLVLTGSIILLIFALSQAPDSGWGTARVLAPLIVSVFMMVAFFIWQTRLHEEHALIPPKMWFIPNFLVYIFVSFCTQIYLTGPILVFSEYWPVAYGWNPLTIGLHVLPMGLTSTIVCVVLPRQILALPPRVALIGANSMAGVFSILMAFASSRERYWSLVFPSMILITVGSSAAYMISNVGIITSVPPDKVGVAAAIFSAAQQVGGAINVAIITTILVQVSNDHPFPSYKGPSSAMWFIVALGLAQTIMVIIFLRPRTTPMLQKSESSDTTVGEIQMQAKKVEA